jgi:hypothetical protein
MDVLRVNMKVKLVGFHPLDSQLYPKILDKTKNLAGTNTLAY